MTLSLFLFKRFKMSTRASVRVFGRFTQISRDFLNTQRRNRNIPLLLCCENNSASPQASLRPRCNTSHVCNTRNFTTASSSSDADGQLESSLDNVSYDRVCTETLDALCDYFEELAENAIHIEGSDVAYSDGVITVNLGREYGTYVINRQSPNKQIWLSSPTSGPKRYDFVGPKSATSGKWIYKHTGDSMHELLQHEIQSIFKDQPVDFMQLPYGS